MKTAVRLISGAVLAVMPQVAGAQLVPPSGQAPSRGPEAVQACTWCHGPRGAGSPAGGIPRISGLSEYYLARQLRSYANGTRRNAAMEAVARRMSSQEAAVVTAYFAQVDAPVVRSAPPTLSREEAEQGRLLATTGSRGLGVQACNNCHGPGGSGGSPAVPYLAGQGASYLTATLEAWRAGTRRNDAGGQMAVIARALTPEASMLVAQYYSSLSAPPPGPLALVRSPPPSRRAVAASAAASARDVRTSEAGADSVSAEVRRLSAADLAAADPARGRAILASGVHGCAACHSIPGVRGANGVVGPPLGGMARRGFIAGQLPNRSDVLVAFLLDPPALVPRTGMPDTGVTREEALHIAAYLYSLER